MDNREAKFILAAYRPGGQDAGDTHFADALEQAQRDPILRQWFAESAAFDAEIAARLQETPVPGGLRESILAGAKVPRRSVFSSRSLWRIAAVFAALAIIVSIAVYQLRKPRLAGWQNKGLAMAQSLTEKRAVFDMRSGNAGNIIHWLRTNGAPASEPQHMPPSLRALSALGCKTFMSDGTAVSLICFRRSDGRLLHVVITCPPAPSGTARSAAPLYVQNGRWATAAWRDGDMQCMLALQGSVEELRRYL